MLVDRTRGRVAPRRSSARARRRLALVATLAATLACLAPASSGQQNRISFTIDWHGPSVGQPSSTPGTLMTEADILRPAAGVPAFGPLPRPQLFLTGGQLALSRYSVCLGHPGGTPCGIEVDGISFGNDTRFLTRSTATRLYFSVDEHAIGHNGSLIQPSVRSESQSGIRDAAADIFVSLQLPPGPLPPGAVPPENVGVVDGNGLVSGAGKKYRGVGLVEPNPPGLPPDPGDNVDGIHLAPLPPTNQRVYFSLDAGFLDPELGIQNSNSAALQTPTNTIRPGDVLVRDLAGGLGLYAQAIQLGLDLAGPGTDDLDALILWENGAPGFQPSQHPYDWADGSHDMLLFSVRRGSAVVGQLDSIFGIPIMPGDILTTPMLTPPFANLIGPRPGIFIAAEDLGLSTTRSGGHADELDGASSTDEPLFDCNENGIEDADDIANGSSLDSNGNSIPDECEIGYSGFCNCGAGLGPCGNDDPTAGCRNSTGIGGLITTSGTTSYEEDDLVLTASQLPANKLGIWMMSTGITQTVLGDGIRCVANPFKRFGSFNSGPAGMGMKGPGLIGLSCATLPPAWCIGPGSTWHFQVWYRDLMGPCGAGTNITNGTGVTFTP